MLELQVASPQAFCASLQPVIVVTALVLALGSAALAFATAPEGSGLLDAEPVQEDDLPLPPVDQPDG